MYFPKETVPGSKAFNATSDVYLEAGHICIKRKIAEKLFASESVVLTVYYAKDNTFMAAPASEELFRSLHKSNQQMLKSKNASGDKSISVQELLIDNNLEDQDRNLDYESEESLHILKIKL
ncbi:MAG: hypothetical protein ABI761_04920 [Saprospiraceae bacterium]